jgi:hypothetical protein
LGEANDKKWARVRVLETVCAAIEKAAGAPTLDGQRRLGMPK